MKYPQAIKCRGCGVEVVARRYGQIYCSTKCKYKYAPAPPSKRPEHKSWYAMHARCYNPANSSYGDYAGRGISVCERWHKFEDFLADMGPRPAGSTLDRINNDGSYEPGNCRWATREQQNNNRRGTVPLSFNGKTQTLSQWARELGVSDSAMRNRLKRGETAERLFSQSQLERRDRMAS